MWESARCFLTPVLTTFQPLWKHSMASSTSLSSTRSDLTSSRKSSLTSHLGMTLTLSKSTSSIEVQWWISMSSSTGPRSSWQSSRYPKITMSSNGSRSSIWVHVEWMIEVTIKNCLSKPAEQSSRSSGSSPFLCTAKAGKKGSSTKLSVRSTATESWTINRHCRADCEYISWFYYTVPIVFFWAINVFTGLNILHPNNLIISINQTQIFFSSFAGFRL